MADIMEVYHPKTQESLKGLKMIDKIELDKSYRWIGPTDKLPAGWISEMGFWFDGKPRKCTLVGEIDSVGNICFKVNNGVGWHYVPMSDFQYFEEVEDVK